MSVIEVVLTKEYIGIPPGTKKRFPAETVKKLLKRETCKLVDPDSMITYTAEEVREIVAAHAKEKEALLSTIEHYEAMLEEHGLIDSPPDDTKPSYPPEAESVLLDKKETEKEPEKEEEKMESKEIPKNLYDSALKGKKKNQTAPDVNKSMAGKNKSTKQSINTGKDRK